VVWRLLVFLKSGICSRNFSSYLGKQCAISVFGHSIFGFNRGCKFFSSIGYSLPFFVVDFRLVSLQYSLSVVFNRQIWGLNAILLGILGVSCSIYVEISSMIRCGWQMVHCCGSGGVG
jgi:hypothetical protein